MAQDCVPALAVLLVVTGSTALLFCPGLAKPCLRVAQSAFKLANCCWQVPAFTVICREQGICFKCTDYCQEVSSVW